MGPTILLDKSTLQSISLLGVHELQRYFYLTVPPVLLFEVLADLGKRYSKQESPDAEVGIIARKLRLGSDGKVNLDFRFLCYFELLGGLVKMDGRPIVGGARIVRTDDGRQVSYLPRQPEMDAVWRWSKGDFSDSDRTIAAQWRERLNSTDPDSFRCTLPALVTNATSLEEANRQIEQMLADDEGQQLLLRWLIRLVSPERTCRVIEEWTFRRWSARGYEELVSFAPYSRHCLRALMLFHLAFANKLVKTTRSSWVDAEYLCYAPFAQVFSSRDELHRHLAPFILEADQSFVTGDELVGELRELGLRRRESRRIQAEGEVQAAESVEPCETGCIHQLHVRHQGAFRSMSAPQRSLSHDEKKRILDEIRPVRQALLRDSELVLHRTWPR